jgi:hypothetical protein
MLMVGTALRSMADAAAGEKPEAVAAALQARAMDFVHVISGSALARKAASAKSAAHGLNRIAVPTVAKSAGRASTIR